MRIQNRLHILITSFFLLLFCSPPLPATTQALQNNLNEIETRLKALETENVTQKKENEEQKKEIIGCASPNSFSRQRIRYRYGCLFLYGRHKKILVAFLFFRRFFWFYPGRLMEHHASPFCGCDRDSRPVVASHGGIRTVIDVNQCA